MNISKLLLVSGVLALPAYAAGGVPDSSMANDGVKPPYGYHAATREACKADPEKCRPDPFARRDKACAQNPEKCKEVKARTEQRRAQCQADPAKCLQERASLADERFRKSDADGNGTLSRTEAEKGMPRLARQFDVVDVNRDGQLSREEMRAARKARHGARASHKA
ncbi:MAG: EF-hand domain-containing protein [Betaproteobacteria bacterium]|nr:MAG: EF-hand domain-containing protein [Betaproteobacteria bacterium]